MIDQPDPPAGAVALAEAVLPEADLTWQPLGQGGLNRLWRVGPADPMNPVRAVIKRVGTGNDPGFAERERKTYAEVLPRLSIRVPSLLGSIRDGGTNFLALEDLATEYRFPKREHRWSPEEMACFLPTYVRLHLEGRSIPHRSWMLSYERPTWSPSSVARQAADLATWGVWGELAGLEKLAGWALAELPHLVGLGTILHLDVHPPNVGLRFGRPCHAALIDWDMTGWGAPEFDLAYLGLQPFGAASQVERHVVLDWYWSERGRMAGSLPRESLRRERQQLADTLFAVELTSVAHRSVVEPYPQGSQPAGYWEAMRPVLFQKLRSLLEECRR